MQSGEWWIDEGGQLTYADGDVGDVNHEGYAFQSALGVDFEDSETPEDLIPGEPMSKATIAWLKEQGADKKAIDYLKNGADARDYALEHMGWIRVKGTNAELWELTDDTLGNLKNADFWDEEDEDSDEELYLEELSTGKTWGVPFKLLSKATSAKGLLAVLESDVRKWHAMDGFSGVDKAPKPGSWWRRRDSGWDELVKVLRVSKFAVTFTGPSFPNHEWERDLDRFKVDFVRVVRPPERAKAKMDEFDRGPADEPEWEIRVGGATKEDRWVSVYDQNGGLMAEWLWSAREDRWNQSSGDIARVSKMPAKVKKALVGFFGQEKVRGKQDGVMQN